MFWGISSKVKRGAWKASWTVDPSFTSTDSQPPTPCLGKRSSVLFSVTSQPTSLLVSVPNKNCPKMNMAAFVWAFEWLAPKEFDAAICVFRKLQQNLQRFCLHKVVTVFGKTILRISVLFWYIFLFCLGLSAGDKALNGRWGATNCFVKTHDGQVLNFAPL